MAGKFMVKLTVVIKSMRAKPQRRDFRRGFGLAGGRAGGRGQEKRGAHRLVGSLCSLALIPPLTSLLLCLCSFGSLRPNNCAQFAMFGAFLKKEYGCR